MDSTPCRPGRRVGASRTAADADPKRLRDPRHPDARWRPVRPPARRAGGYVLATRALRPIDRITHTAQAISGSDLTKRIGHVGPADEVGRLATTFDQMLDRLQAAVERERRFTADAAHELRTPLTAIKGRIGVTLSRCRTSAEYKATLHSLDDEADHLIRLANDLLLLARLDQRQSRWEPETLEVGEVLSAVLEEVQPLAQARQITLVFYCAVATHMPFMNGQLTVLPDSSAVS